MEPLRPNATVTVDGVEQSVMSGDVTIDKRSAPYVTATLQVALASPEQAEAVDPREDIRAVIDARNNLDAGGIFPSDTLLPSDTLYPGGGEFEGRVFDLSVRSREVNHEGRTMRLQLASDEALLQAWRPLTTDTGARAFEGSVRGVCDYVLGKIGAELAPLDDTQAADVPVTAFWEVTNVLINPTFSGDVSGWQTEINNSQGIVHSSAVGGFHGSTCARVTSEGAGYFGISSVNRTRVSPGQVWTGSGYLRANTPGRTGHLFFRVYDEDNNAIKDYFSSEVSVSTSNWNTRVSLTVTMPPRAATVRPVYRISATAAGQFMYLDAVMLYQDEEVVPFFTPNDPTDGYTASWEDGANTSPITRYPIIERLPELFDWDPDTNAWDFLLPITSSVGLALYCDEQRVWRLIDPETFSEPGVVSVSGGNATQGTDLIDLDSTDHVTGVTVRYRWTNRNNVERVKFDTAGEPGKTEVIDLARPFAGVGLAARILARRQGTGRTQDVTAITDWSTTPTKEIHISLPGTVEQHGTVSSVTFDLNEGLMRVQASGLIDYAVDAWNGYIPDVAWEDVDADLEWEDA